ncbi:MAG TPA: 4-hydroxy-3-methylbut-2-enyl diphosphate reductase [Persephonella sp.]|uniref:4-hydroxy-3-methylbut-2-enyl diphosphate reductase n=1 Tax=Persephonella marina (strain DSM 14350 / EX-H1) TaxID=123214 RepID=C0QT65_PERMH|nr:MULTISPECIES: 4-hydroxy-3-methylbut-2-enyl diphosphate reductase [Persephonella]ACO04096.1 4-hydroxy-3-methylbut-2-enyl diphosphate reductase [Persephonella marina EX-H1]HCB70501.1 4-hydroxy-3-methylbut-2-enyl diphosphate reductase [Persephonella sp.]
MANIKVAESAGFCFGVKIAVDSAVEAGKKFGKAFTNGPIIHNKQVVQFLEGLNVKELKSYDQLKRGDTILIRSHGVPPKTERMLNQLGVNVIDATCPFVKKVHEKVKQLVEEGYYVVIIGEEGHPEVIGILGHLEEAGGKGIVVENMEDLIRKFPRRNKVGVVAQTTQNEEFFEEAVGYIASNVEELKVFNTICDATSVRQEEVKRLAKEVDVMIIIGGKHSGNTRRLAQISKALNPNTYHVEKADELDSEWFKNAENIGVSAGASTPDWIIKEVVERIREITG